MKVRIAGLAIVAVTLIGCASPPTPTASPTPTPTAAPTVLPTAGAGGCGGTQVFAGPGPDAALGLADNPWAAATPASAGIVAYFWFPPPAVLFAAGPDGSGTKVLWIAHAGAGPFEAAAHPLDATAPVVRFDFPGPSTVAVPTPGCWRFELTVGTRHATLDVLVAPARPS